VSRGAPNDRAGSVDAVMVTKVGPPPATARDDLRGRLRPPRAEALLVRGRRTAQLRKSCARHWIGRLRRRRAARPLGEERHAEHPSDPGRRTAGAAPAPTGEPVLALRVRQRARLPFTTAGVALMIERAAAGAGLGKPTRLAEFVRRNILCAPILCIGKTAPRGKDCLPRTVPQIASTVFTYAWAHGAGGLFS
jgi:hypothetical protein